MITSGELCGTDEFLEELLSHFGSGALRNLSLEPVAQHSLLLNHHNHLDGSTQPNSHHHTSVVDPDLVGYEINCQAPII